MVIFRINKGCSSTGRIAHSKCVGCEFKSCRPWVIILSYSYLIEFVFIKVIFYCSIKNILTKKCFNNYIYNRCNLRKDWLHRKSAFVAKRAWRIEQVPVLGCFIKTSLLHTCLYYDNAIISIVNRFLFWELLKCCM